VLSQATVLLLTCLARGLQGLTGPGGPRPSEPWFRGRVCGFGPCLQPWLRHDHVAWAPLLLV